MSDRSGWYVGSNGNYFKDAGGARWCVMFLTSTRYAVSRNGEDFPDRFPTAHQAMMFADGKIKEAA